MKKPPALATAILLRLGPGDEAFVGDLLEEYGSGRTRLWFWRQVLSAVALSTVRRIRQQPIRTFSAVATGWAVLLLGFLFGDTVADGMAKLLWNWDRQMGYGSQLWWPFQISAAVVSYAGFALSACAVTLLHRKHAGPMLVAYAASVTVALAASAFILEVLIRSRGAVPVPHPLFYVVSITLPYHWRSGLILAPGVILLCALLTCRRRPAATP